MLSDVTPVSQRRTHNFRNNLIESSRNFYSPRSAGEVLWSSEENVTKAKAGMIDKKTENVLLSKTVILLIDERG